MFLGRFPASHPHPFGPPAKASDLDSADPSRGDTWRSQCGNRTAKSGGRFWSSWNSAESRDKQNSLDFNSLSAEKHLEKEVPQAFRSRFFRQKNYHSLLQHGPSDGGYPKVFPLFPCQAAQTFLRKSRGSGQWWGWGWGQIDHCHNCRNVQSPLWHRKSWHGGLSSSHSPLANDVPHVRFSSWISPWSSINGGLSTWLMVDIHTNDV